MKDIKGIAVILVLCVAIVFLGIDKCGSSRRVDELRGQYEEASRIAKIERVIKEGIIKEQKERIGTLDATIVVLNTTIKDKDRDLARVEGELGNLVEDFTSLEECQAKYNKLVEGFNLCKSINADQESVIFSLNEKYKSQVIISLSWEESYKSIQVLVGISEQQVKELEKVNKRLRLTSGLKTSFVVVLAGLIVYSVVK